MVPQGRKGAEAETHRVFPVVMALGGLVEGPSRVGVDGEVPRIHRKTVAEPVCGLIEVRLHLLHQVLIVPGEASPVLEGGADRLDGAGRLVVPAGDIGPLPGVGNEGSVLPGCGVKPRLRYSCLRWVKL